MFGRQSNHREPRASGRMFRVNTARASSRGGEEGCRTWQSAWKAKVHAVRAGYEMRETERENITE